MNFILMVLSYDIKYVIVACILLLIYILFDNKTTNKIRIIDFAAIIIMTGLSAFRYNVGTDFQSYLARYIHYNAYWNDISSKLTSEILFYKLCYAFSKLTDSPYGVFWLCALILYPSLILFARKISGRPSRIIACYVLLEFFGISNNILRQAIAMELCMFAFFAWKNKRKFFAIIFSIMSVGFHLTAVIGIVLIVLSTFIKPSRQKLGVFLIISLAAFAGIQVFFIVIKYIPIINRYYHYFYEDMKLIMKIDCLGFFLFYLYISFWAFNYSARIKEKMNEKECIIFDRILSMLMLSLPITICGTQMFYFNRIAMYLFQFAIVIIPQFYRARYKNNLVTKVFLTCSLVIFLLFSNAASLDNTYWKYDFQWNAPYNYLQIK
ncbi:MAG: EpsG family protein [Hungatella sp.]|nr:EpsG family protein [Hungatella sp.]